MSDAVSGDADFDYPTSWEQYQKGNWPYDVIPKNPDEDPDAITWRGVHEFAFEAENGETYAGCLPRATILNASHREQPLMLGVDRYQNTVGILHKERYRHVFSGGQTGAGKSTGAKNACLQDAFAGTGFCFIDPGGEDAVDLIRLLPDDRLNDLIFLNPGNEYRSHSIGLNYLETLHKPGEPGFAQECESVRANLLPMLDADEFPRMKGVASNMLRALIRENHEREYNYTLIDLYYVLSSGTARQEYAKMVDESKHEFLKPYASKLVDLADDDLEPLIRRLQTWIENEVIRDFVSARDSDFSVGDMLANDRIMIVKCDVGTKVAQMIVAALTTKIWSAVTSRPSAQEREMMELEGVNVPDIGRGEDGHKPFFLVTDEFHAIASDDTDIGEMLAMARKKRLGLYILTQQLSQLTADQQTNVLGNCSTIVTHDPGRDPDERSVLASGLDGIHESDLGVGRYKFWTVLTDTQGDDCQPFLTYASPPFPPIRSTKEANEAINRSQKRYGSKRLTDVEILSAIPEEFSANVDKGSVVANAGDAELTEDRRYGILESVFAASVETDDLDDAAPIDNVLERARARLDGVSSMHVDTLVQAANAEGTIQISPDSKRVELTADGRRALFSSGTSGSAGRIKHQSPMEYIARGLNEIGYTTQIPKQDGDSLADLVGRLPIEMGGATSKEAQANVDKLKEEYPGVYYLGGEAPLAVEFEKATTTAPSQVAANLRKARDKVPRRHVLFVVGEGENSKTQRAEWLVDKLTEPMFVHARPPRDVDRQFLHEDVVCGIPNIPHTICVPGSEASYEWVDVDGEIILRSEGEEYARFESPQAFAQRSRSDIAYVFRSDEGDDRVTVGDGEQLYEFTDEDVFREEYTPVFEPTIPELLFDGDMPSPDDWSIAILDGETGALLYYDAVSREITPLAEIESIDLITADEDSVDALDASTPSGDQDAGSGLWDTNVFDR